MANIARSVLVKAFLASRKASTSDPKRQCAENLASLEKQYVQDWVQGFETSAAGFLLLSTSQDQVDERRRALTRVITSTIDLSKYLWKQGLLLKVHSLRYFSRIGETFLNDSEKHEAHSSLGLRKNDAAFDGSAPDLVYQPRLSIHGNDEGTWYHADSIILKSGWWIVPASDATGSKRGQPAKLNTRSQGQVSTSRRETRATRGQLYGIHVWLRWFTNSPRQTKFKQVWTKCHQIRHRRELHAVRPSKSPQTCNPYPTPKRPSSHHTKIWVNTKIRWHQAIRESGVLVQAGPTKSVDESFLARRKRSYPPQWNQYLISASMLISRIMKNK